MREVGGGSVTLFAMTGAGYIGHHRLERVLGSGSFATVWLAYDERLDSQVAIKVLADNWARNPDVRRRFIDEARLLRRIDDEHLVRVHAVDELTDGRPYFVMSWADRGTLQDRLGLPENRDGLPVADAVAVTVEVAECLAVVHAYGVIHRDVKPSNVLFRTVPRHRSGKESTLLADFGLAKDTVAGSGFTLAAGTPAYMAPEQAATYAGVDMRADLYSLAAVLFELLTGAPAFRTSRLSDARAGMRPSPPPLVSLRPGLPRGLQAVIDRGLADDPDARFASANELAVAALEALGSDPPRRLGGPVLAGPPTGSDEAAPVDITDSVDSLIDQAHSALPLLADRWRLAQGALQRRLRVSLLPSLADELTLRTELTAMAEIEECPNLTSGVWPASDVLLVTGPFPHGGPGRLPGAVVHRGPVRVLAVDDEQAASQLGRASDLDPVAQWGRSPTTAATLAEWLRADALVWFSTVRAAEALDLVADGVSAARREPAAEDLVARVELLRLAYPSLGELDALRAEASGLLGLGVDERRELRRVLLGAGPAQRVDLPEGASRAAIREAAVERSGHWRSLVNRGRVPYAGRPAADAVARAFDRLATSA